MLERTKRPAKHIAPMLFVVCFFVLGFLAQVSAIATGYATSDPFLQPGMTVALSKTTDANNPTVERADSTSDTKPIGVTVNPNENLVTTGAVNKQVYVQTTGEAEAFVSDLNGLPKKGDLLSVSPLKGVLVKADETTASIVGSALEDFSQDGSSSQTVNKDGTSINVKIDKLKISLDQKGQQYAAQSNSSLERLGRSITGRDVGEIRVVIALIIFLIVLVTEGGIIYGAVSSAITALGRNPMARRGIVKELVRVILIALFVLTIGLGAIYLILWV